MYMYHYEVVSFFLNFILLYNTVLVLPYIDMNPPRVYKNLQAINAGEGVEKREPSYTVGGNAN